MSICRTFKTISVHEGHGAPSSGSYGSHNLASHTTVTTKLATSRNLSNILVHNLQLSERTLQTMYKSQSTTEKVQSQLADTLSTLQKTKIAVDKGLGVLFSDSFIVKENSAIMGIATETTISVPLGHLQMSRDLPSQVEAFRQVCEAINISANPDRRLIECLKTFSLLEPSDFGPPASLKDSDAPKWIKEDKAYQSFVQEQENSILLLRGKSGSGLSFLASFISTSLQSDLSGATILHFSFDTRDIRQCSTFSMLASLTRQMLYLKPSCFVYVRHLFELIVGRSIPKRSGWTLEHLWVFFRSMVLCPSHNTIAIVVDAVDKCDPLHNHFLTELLSLTKYEGARLKIVMTTAGNFTETLNSLTINIDKLDALHKNVEEFTIKRLRNIVQANRSFIEFENDLRQAILTPNPTFLEATLLCKLLENTQIWSVPSSVRRLSNSLPTSLPDIYNQAFLQTPYDNQQWVRDALYWIVHAYQPLRLHELATALAIRYDSTSFSVVEDEIPRDLARDLIRAFGGFIRIQNNQVLLFHESAKDYLLSVLPNWEPRNEISESVGHVRIAELCLDYLLSIDWSDVKSNLGEIKSIVQSKGTYGLLLYAAQNWYLHYQHHSKKPPHYGLLNKAMKLLNEKRWIQLWSHLRPYDRSDTDEADPLIIAAELGLDHTIFSLLKTHDYNHSELSRVLDLAAARGDEEFVAQLLEKKIEIKHALDFSARNGHIKIVLLLLEKGAGVGTSSLEAAAQSGYQDIADILIQKGAEINAKNTKRQLII